MSNYVISKEITHGQDRKPDCGTLLTSLLLLILRAPEMDKNVCCCWSTYFYFPKIEDIVLHVLFYGVENDFTEKLLYYLIFWHPEVLVLLGFFCVPVTGHTTYYMWCKSLSRHPLIPNSSFCITLQK